MATRLWAPKLHLSRQENLTTKRRHVWAKSCWAVFAGQLHLNMAGYFSGILGRGDRSVQQKIQIVPGHPIEAFHLLAKINNVDTGNLYQVSYPMLFEGLGTLLRRVQDWAEGKCPSSSTNTACCVPHPLLPTVKVRWLYEEWALQPKPNIPLLSPTGWWSVSSTSTFACLALHVLVAEQINFHILKLEVKKYVLHPRIYGSSCIQSSASLSSVLI